MRGPEGCRSIDEGSRVEQCSCREGGAIATAKREEGPAGRGKRDRKSKERDTTRRTGARSWKVRRSESSLRERRRKGGPREGRPYPDWQGEGQQAQSGSGELRVKQGGGRRVGGGGACGAGSRSVEDQGW
eukprot:3939235-Rhodomonas_salina.3